MARLKLALVSPRGNTAVGLGKFLEVKVAVWGQELTSGSITIDYDPKIFLLADSVKQYLLDEGSCQKTVSWNLKAISKTADTTVSVIAAAGAVQAVSFQAQVI